MRHFFVGQILLFASISLSSAAGAASASFVSGAYIVNITTLCPVETAASTSKGGGSSSGEFQQSLLTLTLTPSTTGGLAGTATVSGTMNTGNLQIAKTSKGAQGAITTTPESGSGNYSIQGNNFILSSGSSGLSYNFLASEVDATGIIHGFAFLGTYVDSGTGVTCTTQGFARKQ